VEPVIALCGKESRDIDDRDESLRLIRRLASDDRKGDTTVVRLGPDLSRGGRSPSPNGRSAAAQWQECGCPSPHSK